MRTVSIVQPYVPNYRVPLFELLAQQLRESDIALRVIAGTPTHSQAARGDRADPQRWQIDAASRHFHVHGHWIRTHHSWRSWESSDAVIVELAAGCVDSYLALATQRRSKVGVWGHVAQPGSSFDNRALRWQARRAARVFAYTSKGADRASAWGVPRDKITIVQNSVDTTELVNSMDQRRFEPYTLAYIGAFDSTKRIDVLVAALDFWREKGVHVKLLAGGEGPLSGAIADERFRDQVTFFGRVDNATKAAMLSQSSLILCPGRVGLIAVESLATGVPIVTTNSPLHAPEYEYLTPGKTCVVTSANARDFADTVADLCSDRPRLEALRRACRDAPTPSLAEAVQHMSNGIRDLVRGTEDRRN